MSQLSPTWAASAPETPPFALAVDGVRTAGAWGTATSHDRRTGLLGTDGLSGVLWIDRCSCVHTFGMRYPLEVAFLDRAGRVLATTAMEPSRLGRPRLRARSVLEMPAGRLRDWNISTGSVITFVDRAK